MSFDILMEYCTQHL